jgi:predicted TIM-barrel fold metal-dependent hydrolase
MPRTAIISIDGHVKASRAGYRDYLKTQHLEANNDSVKAAEEAGVPDAGNIHPEYPIESQWDSKSRLETLEGVGCVAEVLFPNGQPFQMNRLDDAARAGDPGLAEAGRRAYNRWLVDFCSQAPKQRSGQAVVSFDDVEQAVADVHWAKENGLGGIMCPPLQPGGTYFFDPQLDPIWAAIQETELVLSQHGGAGLPGYSPPGFASIMTLAIENGFYSARSLWQLILGGVFERFPNLKVAHIETQVHFLQPAMESIEMRLSLTGNDWQAFARMMGRESTLTRLPSEVVGTNCFLGVSPFSPSQIPLDRLVGKDEHQEPLPGFHFGVDAAMYGLDYPHFESILRHNDRQLGDLVSHPSVTEDDVRKILFDNAAALYHFDVEALQPFVDRVGFEPSDVLASSAV